MHEGNTRMKSRILAFIKKNFWYSIFVLVVIAFIGFPLFWMALSSFKPSTELFKRPPLLFPKMPTLHWYISAFSSSLVIRYFLNSFIVSVSTMIINMMVATLGAYSLARFRYRGRRFIMASVLSAYCIPPIMLMIPLYRIIAGIGLNSSYAGVILGHITLTLPFCIWILIPFFKKIPKEMEEAAIIDGAPALKIFRSIVLPLCVPGILSAGIMVFILSWNEYLLSSVLTTSDIMKTLTVGLANYISSTEIDWGTIMALGTATTLPIVIMFTAIQKYFVEGLTAGAVKG
jgi:ABC-type glycerol-3-phosphate transport system permease component